MSNAIEHLRQPGSRRQIDEDGVEVAVSHQAVDEAVRDYDALAARLAEAERAAARYRFLRTENANLAPLRLMVGMDTGDDCAWIGADLDYAIDERMARATDSHEYTGKQAMREVACVNCGFNPWAESYRPCAADSAPADRKDSGRLTETDSADACPACHGTGETVGSPGERIVCDCPAGEARSAPAVITFPDDMTMAERCGDPRIDGSASAQENEGL